MKTEDEPAGSLLIVISTFLFYFDLSQNDFKLPSIYSNQDTHSNHLEETVTQITHSALGIIGKFI